MKTETSTAMELLPLLCLCLLTRSGVTSAQLNGPENIKVEGGADVVLPCSLSTKENIESKLFDWRKVAQKDDGQKEVFLYHGGDHYNNGLRGQSEEFKGRVSHFPDELKHGNASIIITNTKISDSGNYTCYFPRLQPPQIFHIQLVVEPHDKVTVVEDHDVILPCSLSTKENIESKEFKWKKVAQKDPKNVLVYNGRIDNNLQHKDFIGQVFHFQDELKHGNASIIIRNTNISDSGVYICDFQKLQPPQTFYIELVVGPVLKDRRRENSGVSLEPSVTSLEVTKNWARLQCKVKGASPKPEVEWQDSDGNKLPAEERPVSNPGGSDDIILLTTVTKTGNYRCVVTQREFNHQTASQIHVYIQEPHDKVTVVEDSDVILPCSLSTKENIESKEFKWKKVAQKDPTNVLVYNGRIDNNLQHKEFKGRVFHFQDELKHGNASIIIRNTKISDSGVYTCDFPNPQPSQTFYIELVVGVSLEPSVTSLEVTKNWARLQCKVKGASPKPEVEWQDSDGNKLPAEERPVSNPGGPDDIILLTTVTKTGNYRCVVTQREFNHQTASQIHVYIQEFSTGWTVGLVLLALVGLAVLVYMGYIILNRNKESPNGWIVALVLAGVLAVLVYMGYITFSHNEEFSTGWTVGLVLLALLALVALVDLIGLVCKRCIPLNCNKESPNGWIVAIVFAGVLAVLVYMGYITFSHNEGSPTGWTVDLVLLALVAVVALVVLAVLVYKRCNPLKHNKARGTDEGYEIVDDVIGPSKENQSHARGTDEGYEIVDDVIGPSKENQSNARGTDEGYEIVDDVIGPSKENQSNGSPPEPNALEPFMMEERL